MVFLAEKISKNSVNANPDPGGSATKVMKKKDRGEGSYLIPTIGQLPNRIRQ